MGEPPIKPASMLVTPVTAHTRQASSGMLTLDVGPDAAAAAASLFGCICVPPPLLLNKPVAECTPVRDG